MAIKMNIAPNGRVCIPADVRARLGVKEGGAVFLEENKDGQYVLTSHAQRVKRVQKLVAEAMKGKQPYTVDQFLRERRADWGEED